MFFNRADVLDRFERKVRREEAGCHPWVAARHPFGHGLFWLPKPAERLVYAHRLALEIKLQRELLPGEQALHACDNPPCVNPDHLELGNAAKNMADAAARGRTMRGEGHYLARLTERDVREIKLLLAAGLSSQRGLAERYGVSRSNISLIAIGKNWKHVV